MNLFPSVAAFIAVAALVFPLYEGNTAIYVSLIAGALVAIFIALGQKKQSEQQQHFEQALKGTSEVLNENLSSYQKQLTEQVAELSKATNEQLMTVWKTTQADLQSDSKVIQEKSVQLLTEIEALQKQQHELTITTTEQLQQWLQQQQTVAQQTFEQVKDSHAQLLDNTAQSNAKVEQLWATHHEQHLAMRQQERDHVLETQTTVTNLIEKNAQVLNEQIIAGWETTRQSLAALRTLENEHSVKVLQSVEEANASMRLTLDEQRTTFETAENFYKETYEQIKGYTKELTVHEKALATHHEQLIHTQTIIKESITNTLDETMKKHRDVLVQTEQTLAASIEQVQDQRTASQEQFEEFLEQMLDSVENLEQQSKEMNTALKTEVSRVIEETSDQLGELTKKLQRSSEQTTLNMTGIIEQSKSILAENHGVLAAMHTQIEETKLTAKTLENAFKEVSTLNKQDMDILQKLMR